MPSSTLLVTIIASLLLLVLIIFLIKRSGAKKHQSCPGGQWTTIIHNFGTGFPRTFEITFRSVDGRPIAGKFFEQAYLWIFPRTPKQGDLKSVMSFHRQWINAIYKLKILPDSDIEVTIQK